jgi:hypothetical protein
MTSGVRFLWTATRGHRLRPWRSEYLRWRVETFTGKSAEQVRLRDFFKLLYSERRQFIRFLRWLSELRSYAASPEE